MAIHFKLQLILYLTITHLNSHVNIFETLIVLLHFQLTDASSWTKAGYCFGDMHKGNIFLELPG